MMDFSRGQILHPIHLIPSLEKAFQQSRVQSLDLQFKMFKNSEDVVNNEI